MRQGCTFTDIWYWTKSRWYCVPPPVTGDAALAEQARARALLAPPPRALTARRVRKPEILSAATQTLAGVVRYKAREWHGRNGFRP